MDDRERQIPFEVAEIPVAVQQRMPVLDAERRDQAIDRLSDGLSSLPQLVDAYSVVCFLCLRYVSTRLTVPGNHPKTRSVLGTSDRLR